VYMSMCGLGEEDGRVCDADQFKRAEWSRIARINVDCRCGRWMGLGRLGLYRNEGGKGLCHLRGEGREGGNIPKTRGMSNSYRASQPD
jgi:hypothetical protein